MSRRSSCRCPLAAVRVQEGQPRRQRVERALALRGEDRERDDAHGLLRIVGAVREAHVAGRNQLRLAEERIDPARARQAASGPPARNIAAMIRYSTSEDQHAEQEAEERRGHHRQEDLPQQALVRGPSRRRASTRSARPSCCAPPRAPRRTGRRSTHATTRTAGRATTWIRFQTIAPSSAQIRPARSS